MKKISKKKLDSLIYLSRQYWKTGDKEMLTARTALAQDIEKECGIHWIAIIEFVDSIVQSKGIASDADNRTIYIALGVFGWDVVNDGEINLAG